jgi:zinc/manganese transport system substrate-binding protein
MTQPSRSTIVAGMLLAIGVGLTACATAPPGSAGGGSGPASTSAGGTVIPVAASINAWGSILAQLGGSHVRETSIISNPDTDPHDYEPTPADGRTIAGAMLFVQNGIGYDPWAARALAANPAPNRQVLDVGQLTGVPDGGNPHRWYSPADVRKVADAITSDLKRADPADSAYFDQRRQSFENTALARYHQLSNDIKTRYAGTPVGASESIFAPLAQALGLNLITPAGFLTDVSEGTDPSAQDKSTIDAQISGKQIKVYVFNSQNATPDVAAQVDAAKRNGIPVITMTETLTPANATFQDWQSDQLQALANALGQATGR